LSLTDAQPKSARRWSPLHRIDQTRKNEEPMKSILPPLTLSILFIWALLSWNAGAQEKQAEVRPIPKGPLGDQIRLGRELVEQTTSHPLTKAFVGNSLDCTDCHLKNGTDLKAASFIGVATAYPAWSPRERRVITLEDRILNCFMRSCNGIRPPLGSNVSVSIAAYITWLSADQPIRMNAERPAGPLAVTQLKLDGAMADKARGAKVYSKRCADCHGDDGQGDADYPPVWGEKSYNDGAGLANITQLASWIKVAMPLDKTDLSDQESLDVSAFLNSHPRPKFQLREHLPEKARLGEYNSGAED
jgi:thiosulfate dehydrogenase